MRTGVGAEADDSPLIRLRSVSKTFRAGRSLVPAVADLSIDVKPGEFVSLVGPSGCGKTTVMMMIGGLIAADQGEIFIHDRKVVEPYTNLGIVFQNAELLDWRTSFRNVMLQIQIRKLPEARYAPVANDLLKQMGLDGFADKYPHELSGGMRQRVALCRALVHDPEILLLDEPFGALDALTRDQMNFDLQRLWLEKRKTAILVTHSIEEAVWMSDRVLVMTPRPARVAEDIAIDLPRPRSLQMKTTPAFNAYTGHIRALFERLGVLRTTAAAMAGEAVQAAPSPDSYLLAWIAPAVTALGCLLIWEAAVRFFAVPIYLLPAPSGVIVKMFAEHRLFLIEAVPTLTAIIAGFLAAVAIGVPIATFMVYSSLFRHSVQAILITAQVLPKVALAPLFIVWFGFGLLPKVLMTFLISFFPIVIDSVIGLASVRPESLMLVRSMGGSRTQAFFKIRLPNALPSMFGGFKVAITFAVVGTLVAEFVGSDSGLGYVLVMARGNLDTLTVFAVIGWLVVIGFLLYYAVELLERMVLRNRTHDRARELGSGL